MSRFVLSTPGAIQYSVLSIALVAGLFALTWSAQNVSTNALALHTILGGTALLILLTIANPRLWRPWIHVVADHQRLQLPSRDGGLLAVRWAQVGRIERGCIRILGLSIPAIVAYLDLDDKAYAQLSWRRDDIEDPTTPSGFRPVPIVALGHDLEAVLASLERCRTETDSRNP